MKRILSILVLVTVMLLAVSLMAQTKVVVIPLVKNKVRPNQECPDPSIMLGVDPSGNIVCGSSSFCSSPVAKVTGIDASLNFLCSIPGKKIVFVSSTSSNGNLGGLSGADQKCQTLADSASIHGTFKAWLSDSSESPSTRFTQAAVPYVLVDGSLIADNWTDLIDGSIARPININENGVGTGPLRVWTGTYPNGTWVLPPQTTCGSWFTGTILIDAQGVVGDTASQGSYWSNNAIKVNCDLGLRLYCFEQ